MGINLDLVGKELEPIPYEMDAHKAILYALGVGTPAEHLNFLYEADLKILPAFAVIPAFPVLAAAVSRLGVNPFMIVHGEQSFAIHRPLPSSGRLTTSSQLEAIYDKGKGALIVIGAHTRDEKGQEICSNTFSLFARGEGGFGGPRGPSGEKNIPPSRPPDKVASMKTREDQALVFRLSGDINPLHADPNVARAVGYDRPILHGLCTFGFCGRAALEHFCGMDPARVAGMEARFAGIVYPGETIVAEMWKEGSRVILQAKTAERGEVALNQAAVALR